MQQTLEMNERQLAEVNSMTQTDARNWLVKYDAEQADYWQNAPDDWDFVQCVRENLRDFGPVDEPPVRYSSHR